MKKLYRFTRILCAISIIYMIGHGIFDKGKKINNVAIYMDATVTNQVEAYGTDYVYDSAMASDADPIVIEEGINGSKLTYDGINYINISEPKNQVLKVGTGKAGTYSGTLTGYGPDCYGCSVIGNVSCLTREGTNHSLITDGIYYNDSVYGSVRILAADQNEFPCGTIVKVNNGILPEFIGIVLDTGVTMRQAYLQGIIWMDLAYSSESDENINSTTSHNTKFNVQRWGW